MSYQLTAGAAKGNAQPIHIQQTPVIHGNQAGQGYLKDIGMFPNPMKMERSLGFVCVCLFPVARFFRGFLLGLTTQLYTVTKTSAKPHRFGTL